MRDTTLCVASLNRCGNRKCMRYITPGIVQRFLDGDRVLDLGFADLWERCEIREPAKPTDRQTELRA